jgi:sterol desaturase/sphingolipid hydroxylase (fatty acid hydroxylase superfamily)
LEHLEIDHSDVPIRLFKSDFLEFFSHIHPVMIIVLWLPVVIFFLVRSYQVLGAQTVLLPVFSLLFGLFLWTLTEYLMHRFVFHFKPRNEWQKRISFLFHGVHHAQPQCRTRLVMPLPVSIPLAAVFLVLFYLIFSLALNSPVWMAASFSGFLIGYLIYDLTHYATHHFAMRKGYLKFLKRYHMMHHYKSPNARFGVSSPIWDMAFATKPN